MAEYGQPKNVFKIIVIAVFFLLVVNFFSFFYLYDYIASVEKRCLGDRLPAPTVATRRRRAATLEDNAVTTADHVEFINPNMKREKDSGEGNTPNNAWVWLTSYSRIPVSFWMGLD